MAKKKSYFQRTFMTVTPFSKIIALILFIALPFITFLIGLNIGLGVMK